MTIELTDDDLWTLAQLTGKVGIRDQAIFRHGIAAGIERAAQAADAKRTAAGAGHVLTEFAGELRTLLK